MANPSNLYAEKIFSEHPLALWALDDEIDYLSLISNTQRNITTWTNTGGTVTLDSTVSDEPLPGSAVNKIVGDNVSTSYGQVVSISPNLINLNSLDQELETFSIGMYVYSANEYMTSYEIGYEYTDPTTSTIVSGGNKKYETTISNNWIFISETFKRKDIAAPIRIVFKANYINVGTPVGGYTFYTNGVTFGQWSEEFAPTSLGQQTVDLPTGLSNYLGTKAIEAKAYGLDDFQGYYISNTTHLFAKNSGIPMVYGASNVTTLHPNSTTGKPSLIVPGHGFLNNSGKYNEYTAEFWIRLENFSSEPRRIFGPVASAGDFPDGIYVEGPFVKIKIGENIGSHFIGEWSRPMLFDFKIGDGVAGLLINGDPVISMPINIDDIDLPDEYSSQIVSGAKKHQDWLGFYLYEDLPIIQIDCVAIYSYQVSSILAKRRFAYGQAVEFPENINTSYGGTSVFIDYPFADYTNNYIYPDVGRFNNGISDNMLIKNNMLHSPEYSLPDVVFEDTSNTIRQWSEDGFSSSSNLDAPSVTFGTDNGYIVFDKLNVLKDDVKALYGIFTTETYPVSKQVLFKIENKINGDYFLASLLNNEVVYQIKVGTSDLTTLYTEGDVVLGDAFFVGINIPSLMSFFGRDVSLFFGNKNQLRVFVSGQPGFTQTFTGEIQKIGFCTENNLKKILGIFNVSLSDVTQYDAGDSYFGENPSFWSSVIDGGTPGSIVLSNVYQHTASYTLIPSVNYGVYGLDIATDSYWEDYLPLTFFAQYINDNKSYDLDFIQFNVGYPALPVFTDGSYDTSDAIIKTYVTFRYETSSIKNFNDHFVNSYPPPENGVIHPGTTITGYSEEIVQVNGNDVIKKTPIYDDFYNTKYEVVDGMIIYPPVGAKIEDISMSTHIEIVTKTTIDGQIKLKSLQYASESFNSSVPNPIGTRFGSKIYPYKKYGLYYDYKSKNPYRIYKGSTPYLYLTRDSGIEKVGVNDPLINSGLAVPLNENMADQYKIIAIQLATRFNKDKFSTSPIQIFEIEGKDSYIKFFMVANDSAGNRARIYAVNAKSGKFENGIAFYLNGKLVREPVISPNMWNMIGISFQKSIDLNSYVGTFRINGPLLTNLMSFYKSTNLQEIQKSITRPWFRVKQSLTQSLEWLAWKSAFTWNGVLVSASINYYGIDPAVIYKTYTGTNKIIMDDSKTLEIKGYEYGIYNYTSAQSQVLTAV